MRNADLVIADIKDLIKTKGYIYAFCLILYEDFHVNLETIHKVNYKIRLSVKESTLILGFLVQNEIDFSIPDSPEFVIELKDKTYALMEELHSSYFMPQIEKFQKKFLQVKEEIPFFIKFNEWN